MTEDRPLEILSGGRTLADLEREQAAKTRAKRGLGCLAIPFLLLAFVACYSWGWMTGINESARNAAHNSITTE